ncbi:hypothetical protein C474_16534 [Halogeometricum pallidum JCM 14848]|uniref:Uncharacterized protein n=1 Tax=Halogeometricum pallidum JCM 14848 TaxID=1227487 RepID=M0CZP3_HALPD|nr:hypothetical protein [Halogeometricum pallidum]ELZ27364.1 hypothetical protein C474_16534 [Halogeometricum pallidum JCM 14848]
MALSTLAWVTMLLSLLVLPGVASVALVRSLRTEERKLELLRAQGSVDSYSPRALADLREWVQAHPNDPYATDARERHNECVRTLREIDEPYYDWSPEQIENLETIDR